MSKYEPLREHLARLDDVVWAAKLVEVETILGSNLPKSAREHRTWWANSGGSLVHQNAWLDAGWRVERTDLTRDVIVFRRQYIGGTSLAPGRVEKGARSAEKNHSTDKRLVRAMSALRHAVTVTLRSEWTVLGDVHKTPCSSTTLPAASGVVRVTSLDGDELKTVIVASASIQEFYRGLRMEIKGQAEGAENRAGRVFAEKSGFDLMKSMECDFVRTGNAWLLTDGRGRKANMDDPAERYLVAQLLYLQEIQSGRPSRILKL